MKSSNIRHRQDRAQNKDGTEKAACRPFPAGDRQPEPLGLERGNCRPGETLLTKLKQASWLRLLGVLDSHHLPHKGHQRSTHKTEQQRQKR